MLFTEAFFGSVGHDKVRFNFNRFVFKKIHYTNLAIVGRLPFPVTIDILRMVCMGVTCAGNISMASDFLLELRSSESDLALGATMRRD
jgi:hypothetical protein